MGRLWPSAAKETHLRLSRSGDCCVQFNESDCDLVPRWMQHEGIYFFFEHA
ncbi:contractile injection system protein, VgrG/Pvc8 family [Delftia acidovorans]|uniref:contractile injection system protein, VgrG/Pvc8 family n=1 Tax=Delftia acidovorans TaxID=80866 RepID=UPI0035A2586A